MCSWFALLVGLAPAFAGGRGEAAQVVRMSIASDGSESNNISERPSISGNGRRVAFTSLATNLVPNDINSSRDVFVADLLTGQVQRASVSSNGTQGFNVSESVSLSSNGRFLAFRSFATNLVSGDLNQKADIFFRDLQTGTTARVSLDAAGQEAGEESLLPAIAGDGRSVAFVNAGVLTPDDTNSVADVYLRDLIGAQTILISVNDLGEAGDGTSGRPGISEDGTVVVFSSTATNLVAEDTNDRDDIFVRDLSAGTTSRVSVTSTGTQANGFSQEADVSADGRFVVFTSHATNLVPGDTNGVADVFVHDRMTGQTERISVSSAGAQGAARSGYGHPSADGRFVVFESDASNLVPGDTNSRQDIFVRDRETGLTTRVSTDAAGGQADKSSRFASMSRDGGIVAFESDASNLIAADTNLITDIFAIDRELATLECRRGTVNKGVGPIADVLLVNGSAGVGVERRLVVDRNAPFEIRMELPPALMPGQRAPYALYVWRGRPSLASVSEIAGGLGTACYPMLPLDPAFLPDGIWNPTGLNLLGMSSLPAVNAPTTVFSRMNGIGKPVTFFLQGIIADPASAAVVQASVTNGVLVVVQ